MTTYTYDQVREMKKPDYHSYDEFLQRSRKLADHRALDIDPYPPKYQSTHELREVIALFNEKEIGDSEQARLGTTPYVQVAGRLVLFRSMGKNAFAHIQEGIERLQIMFNKDETQVKGYHPVESVDTLSPYKWIEKKVDLGDWIGVSGHLFRTHKGELTLFVKELTMLCKTLLPLADKHSGLEDKELRYRQRWLDLISHPQVVKNFLNRTFIIREIRSYFEEARFLEVETPILQSIYGGAEARPFETKLHALDQDMFLRISLEIPLKKLMVGGLGRVYEMGKVFRNEGIDRNHNPEFTLLEAYAAYWDYHDMMGFVEKLFERLALKLYGTTQVPYTPHEGAETITIEMKAPWKRLSMEESLKVYGGIDISVLSDEEMKRILIEAGYSDPDSIEKLSHGLLIAALFSVKVEPHLLQPHHIYDHPIETTPLCKPHRDPAKRKKGLVERFESFIITHEICNAYTELNDPELQRTLLEKQASRRERGDVEASPMDEDFIKSICQGMPPTGGIGIGIDRLIMIMTNLHSIRDVLYFPWMKPTEG